MHRFFVCRAYFKWKGKMYYKGDLLPENFTHHDKARSIYNSRIGECEAEDPVSADLEPLEPTPITTPLSGGAVVEVPVEEQEKIPEAEIPVVQDEVPEVTEATKVDEVPKTGTEPAAFSLLGNFTPGTPQ